MLSGMSRGSAKEGGGGGSQVPLYYSMLDLEMGRQKPHHQVQIEIREEGVLAQYLSMR